MKSFILLFLLISASYASKTQTKVGESSNEKITIDRKNAINMQYIHGLAGISYQRNYYDYATYILSVGGRTDPNLMAASLGLEWTLENSTLEDGLYLMPSVILYRTGEDDNLVFNDAYKDVYGINLRENDQAIGLSFTLRYKWIFDQEDTSYVIGAGAEFIRLRSSNGLGLVANLGVIF